MINAIMNCENYFSFNFKYNRRKTCYFLLFSQFKVYEVEVVAEGYHRGSSGSRGSTTEGLPQRLESQQTTMRTIRITLFNS